MTANAGRGAVGVRQAPYVMSKDIRPVNQLWNEVLRHSYMSLK